MPSTGKNSDAKKELDAFNDRWKAKKREEELRLAYVAFTRAKHISLERRLSLVMEKSQKMRANSLSG